MAARTTPRTTTPTSTWTPADMPSQRGKLALVTGANSGIGRETTLALARAGARVIMAGRDAAKVNTVADALRAQVPGADLEPLALDLADLASVAEAAATVRAAHPALDLLINNAGVMAVPERRTTKDGFELTFGTNHLGHFALTGHLLPTLLAAEAPRVVTVSAIAYRWKTGELTDLNSEEHYRPMGAYAKSKRANVVFTQELARRTRDFNLTAVAVHPGASLTGLQQHTSRGLQLVSRFLPGMFQPADQAAWSTLYAATEAAGIASGDFVGPTGRQGMHGSPGVLSVPDTIRSPETGRALWTASEQLTGVVPRTGA
ncbi:oxidoreductase [Streptomyces sp. 150FB]|uniref:oxidoreductase n=1 Tax=Streptomyces sp. 150FB TaxID=1576605 RepID=UPI00069904ED|nr:oxidoreductase [Streptomyces sp. 150FB]